MTPSPGPNGIEPAQHWPWTSMLLIGTFGPHDDASRRYHWRCGWALGGFVVALIVWSAVATQFDAPFLRWIPAMVTAVTFTYIGHELWRLVSSLDELTRRLQLEAMAIAYLVGLPVFVTAQFVSGAAGWSWQLPAVTYLCLDSSAPRYSRCAPGDTGEESPSRAARRAPLHPGRPGRRTRRVTSDHQCNRDGQVRSEPAARLQDCGGVRVPH